MLTVHLQSFSPFHLVLSLFPGPSSEPTIALLSLCSLPTGARYHQRVMSLLGARDAAVLSYSVNTKMMLPFPFATKFKRQRILPRSQAASPGRGELGSAGGDGSEDERFCLMEKKKDRVSLQTAKAHKDICALKATLPGMLVGDSQDCLHLSPWQLMGVSIATLHKSYDSSLANWRRGLIMGS